MTKPLISLVMPCYQNGATLARTVESIKAQTFTDWELIAVDDGSADDTLCVLKGLAAGEPRMRVLHQENGGVSSARNAGMDAAHGEWLMFVDADDWLTEDALCHLTKLLSDDVDIVCGAYEMHYFDQDGRREKHVCADGDLQTVLESLIRGDSALNSMCARLYRTEMIRRAGVRAPLGVKVGEDVLFNLDAFAAARAWHMSDRTIYIYEFGGNSAMMRAKHDRYQKSVPMIEGIGRFICAHHLETALFRAHIDIYVRTLRVDHGRVRAALRMTRGMVAAITKGVNFSQLCAKQKIYYLALRICPLSSALLP